jgi:hypothetical protein
MTTRLRCSAICAALALLAGPAAAEGVYKWVDAEGRTHFGSRPPVGQKTETLNTQVGPADAAPAQGGRSWQEQLELSNQKRQQARDQEQAAAKTNQENQQRCLAARGALDSLERGGARYYLNSQGEREYIDDNQRQAARDVAAQRVATYCR